VHAYDIIIIVLLLSKGDKSFMILQKEIIKNCCLGKVKNEWLASKDSFPTFLIAISSKTKSENEKYILSVSDDFKEQFNHFSHIPMRRKRWKKKTLNLLKQVLSTETIIGTHLFLSQENLDSFQEGLTEFLRNVRRFAPELSIDGIGQAVRNYIVYLMFNELNQLPHDFNAACFGYSMLYPFTDNYIDSKEYSDEDKKQYNEIIRDKIEGNRIHPKSIHHKKTCDLLQAIESRYPRNHDSTIYNLLLMMLEAQEDSLLQQNTLCTLTADERLDISIYKGGISVLIDRFFVEKEITEEDMVFYLEFGFFLQLADDLRDISEDSNDGNQTIFTLDLGFNQQEKIVNKMLHFLNQIMDSYHAENNIFKDFILSNCYQLIYLSVAGSMGFFSTEYLDKLGNYLNVNFVFLENIKTNTYKNNIINVQDNYMKILDEMIL